MQVVGDPPVLDLQQVGIEVLRGCLEKLHAARYELLTTPFNISLAQGLAAIGQIAEGAALVDETLQRVEANGDDLYSPELLRVKGGLLLSTSSANADEAERTFVRSIELSRRQGARSWGLRTGDRSRGSIGGSGTTRGIPGASAAGVRAVRGGFGHGRSQGRRTPVGDVGLV